jgi:hypothetical protein
VLQAHDVVVICIVHTKLVDCLLAPVPAVQKKMVPLRQQAYKQAYCNQLASLLALHLPLWHDKSSKPSSCVSRHTMRLYFSNLAADTRCACNL